MTEESTEGYAGQQGLSDDTSDYNVQAFIVQQMLGRISTMRLVKVMAVTNNGGVEPVGFIDAMPLVNQTDGLGKSTPHETIFNLPYTRIQGGANAVIMDPKVGDIGWAAIADRDISAVKATKAQANPGSRRRFDLADGVYIGGILNGTPTQYVLFKDDGMTLVSPSKIRLEAPQIEIEASAKITHKAPEIQIEGPTHTYGIVTGDQGAVYQGAVVGQGHSLSTHIHIAPNGATGGPIG